MGSEAAEAVQSDDEQLDPQVGLSLFAAEATGTRMEESMLRVADLVTEIVKAHQPDELDPETKQRLRTVAHQLASLNLMTAEYLEWLAPYVDLELGPSSAPKVSLKGKYKGPISVAAADPTGKSKGKVFMPASSAENVDEATHPLFQAILPVKQFPAVDQTNQKLTYLEVTDGRTLQFGDLTIHLTPDEVFFFNAIMLLRDQNPLARKVRELGWAEGAGWSGRKMTVSALNSRGLEARQSLFEKVNGLVGTEVFYAAGIRVGTRYLVAPSLVVVEGRVAAVESEALPEQGHPALVAARDDTDEAGTPHNWSREVSYNKAAPVAETNYHSDIYAAVRAYILDGTPTDLIDTSNVAHIDWIRKAMRELAGTDELLYSQDAMNRYHQMNGWLIDTQKQFEAFRSPPAPVTKNDLRLYMRNNFGIELSDGADSWKQRANCLGVDPDLFFPERGASTREAKAVCRACEVRLECLEDALDYGEKHGIWGGLSERERRRVRRQRALASKEASAANEAAESS